MTGTATRFVRKGSLLLLAFVVLHQAIRTLPSSRHPAIGRWRVANFEITVGTESLASIQGVPCDWRLVDAKTITVSPRATIWSPDLNATIQGAFTFETIQDRRYALVDFLSFPLALEPVERSFSPIEEKDEHHE